MKKIFSMNRFEGWNLSLPLIQGGMGVGVSLSGLAGAVASEGGMGVISTAQIGFEEPDFVGNEEACNLRSIRKHIVRAKVADTGCRVERTHDLLIRCPLLFLVIHEHSRKHTARSCGRCCNDPLHAGV